MTFAMAPTGSALTVEVSGGRTASAAATWGQVAVWNGLRRRGLRDPDANDGGVVPVPVGRDLPFVAECVRRLVTAHETLRTTYTEVAGGLWQHVTGAGPVEVVLGPATPADAAAAGDALLADLRATAFRLDREWPVRFGVVHSGGTPLFLVVVFHRIALDRESVRLVTAYMTALLAGGEPAGTVRQPLDRAAFETSAEGRAHSDAALRRASRQLRGAAPSMTDFAPRPGPGPLLSARERTVARHMHSEAVSLAAEVLAERWRVTSSAVLLAATATALRCYTGHEELLVALLSDNRLSPGERDLVGTLTDGVLVRFDLRGATFDEVVRRVFASSVEAFLAGSGDPDRMEALRRVYGIHHGAYIDLDVIFDDARTGPARVPLDAEPSLERLRELATRTTVQARHPWVRVVPSLLLILEGTPGDTTISIWADSAYLPADVLTTMLYGVERLLIAACGRPLSAADLVAAAQIPAVTRAPSAVPHRRGWVDLTGSREVWRQVAGPASTLVAEPDGTGGYRLVAYVAGDDRPLTELHRSFVAALDRRTDVHAADRYVRCAGPPPDHADAAGWRALPVREEGPGR